MYIIPIMFAFTSILLVDQPLALTQTFVAAVFGFLSTGAVIVGHMYVRLGATERTILSIGALGLFWPSLVFQVAGGVILATIFISQRMRYSKSLVSDGTPIE